MYTTNSIIDKNAKPYSPDKIQNLVAQFQRDGYLFLKGVVTTPNAEAVGLLGGQACLRAPHRQAT